MHKKFFVIVSVSTIIISIGIYLFISYSNKKNLIQNSPVQTIASHPMIKTIKLAGGNDLCLPKGTYPQFDGVDTAFNDEISTTIQDAWQEFIVLTTDNWNAHLETAHLAQNVLPEIPFEFHVEYEIGEVSSRYISAAVRFGGYPAGGAHGYTNIVTFSYDVINHKNVTLADIFLNDLQYLEIISKYVRADLQQQFAIVYEKNGIDGPIDTQSIYQGTKPEIESFKNFIINGNKIIFYFSPYQVAAYAMGEQHVIMPIQ
ncbi:MAG: RsiV family protein [bacterium]